MKKPPFEVGWRLRELMADRGVFMTTGLIPLLRDQGIDLSREQIFRIASGTPQRLSLELLGALCAALACTPNDLIQFRPITKTKKAVGAEAPDPPAMKDIRPVRARVVRPDYLNDSEK
jgi:DNA-binding Xre family transcriptional regulator